MPFCRYPETVRPHRFQRQQLQSMQRVLGRLGEGVQGLPRMRRIPLAGGTRACGADRTQNEKESVAREAGRGAA